MDYGKLEMPCGYMKENNDANIARPRLVAGNLSPEEREARAQKEKVEIARTGLLFTPKEFGAMFGQGHVMHYFDKLKNATNGELKTFSRKIKAFKNEISLKGRAFCNCETTKYNVLKAAIDHELLRRQGILFAVYKILIPLRQQLAWWTGHRKAHYHKEFGIIFSYEPSWRFLYEPISQHFLALKRFWLNNWRWLLSTSGGLGVFYLVLSKMTQKY